MPAKDLKELLNSLVDNQSNSISIGGFECIVRLFDESSKFSISTVVFFGGNYIPKIVRKCLIEKPPFPSSSIKAYCIIDEAKFQVILRYLAVSDHLTCQSFEEILEEFICLAEKWYDYLDETGKKDLIHVHNR